MDVLARTSTKITGGTPYYAPLADAKYQNYFAFRRKNILLEAAARTKILGCP